MMRVYSAQGSIVYQEVYAKPSCEKYVRGLNVSEGTWSKWFRIDNYGTSSLSELASALGAYLTKTAASIDLNTLNQKGIFATASVLGTSTWHDLHYPVYSSECFCLTIMRDSNVGFQIAIVQSNTNTFYFRHRWSETTWGEWRAITTTNV